MSGRTSSSAADGGHRGPGAPGAGATELAELAERVRSLTRPPSLRERWARLRRTLPHVLQCAVAAGIAWLLARTVIGHPQPFFAPVAAIVGLGLGYGQRLRRVAEITVGVAVGVFLGDVCVKLFGSGPWQIGLVVVIAMSIAVLLDAGPLMTTQAGVQSAIILALAPPSAAYGLGRWEDAVTGGVVALVVAALVPGTPLRRPRLAAGRVLDAFAGWLRDASRATRTGDVELAYRALAQARESDALVGAVRTTSADAMSVARSSPFRRKHRDDVRVIAELAGPLDRAVRNGRVLLRRVTVLVRRQEPLPAGSVELLDALADAVAGMAEDLREHHGPDGARQRLLSVVAASSQVPTGQGLSADVVLAQVRSIVFDLLECTGLAYADVQQLLGVEPGAAAPRD